MMFGEKIIKTGIIKIGLGLAFGLVAIACSNSSGTVSEHTVNRVSGGTQPDFETVTFVNARRPDARGDLANRPISNGERFSRTLDAHNSVRAAHNLQPLTWSSRLANYAQQWANQSAKARNCGMKHRPHHGPFKQQYGENIWWASPRIWSDGVRELQDITIQRVVKDWADEKPFYDYATNSCRPGEQCGHYTQIVWRETKEVGCAYQQCADKSQLWVCNYSPAGNYIGERPY